jgi:hypothetical protein
MTGIVSTGGESIMMRGLIVGAVAMFSLALVVDSNVEGGKDPVAIKVVMQKAMKGGLCGKAAKGKASEAELKTLASLFADLAANKCPKGDADDWKTRTSALAKASAALVKDDNEENRKALQKAADCKGCHSEHK